MKHFIDCLEIVKYIEEGTNIVDVGTGAGFPGLVIAIYFSGKVKITLLDALNKRLVFLQDVVDKLNLKSFEMDPDRALVLMMMALLGKETADETLMLALLYIML